MGQLKKIYFTKAEDTPTNHISHTYYMIHILSIDQYALPKTISLNLYFLNDATASTDSGQYVFPTRALKLMKFSKLIFKRKSDRTNRGVTLSKMRFWILFI
jgi:hypothetical protein